MENIKTDLEIEFNSTYKRVGKEIQEQLDIAANALEVATKLAREHGVPFSTSISPLGQTYVPETYQELWGDKLREVLDDDKYTELVYEYGLMSTYGEICGWEHSAVC